jgi:hypothetical protein
MVASAARRGPVMLGVRQLHYDVNHEQRVLVFNNVSFFIKGHGPKQMYEARIVLLRADSMELPLNRRKKKLRVLRRFGRL